MDIDPDRLVSIPLFEGLSEEDRARLVSWFEVEQFPAGKRLVREGGSGYAFLVVDDGTVRVEHEGKTVAELGAGDVLGEMAFFGDGRRNADVIAITDVRILWMFGTQFREMQSSMPEVAARLEELVRRRSPSEPES